MDLVSPANSMDMSQETVLMQIQTLEVVEILGEVVKGIQTEIFLTRRKIELEPMP